MARPEPGPLHPPTDLHDRKLLLTSWVARLYRVHSRQRDPLFFGRTGVNRFDDPQAAFGVLYASANLDGAFSETFAGVSSLSVPALSARAWSELTPTRDLNLCDLRRHGLARIGADGRLCTGSHAEAQAWSRAIWSHPSAVDGICYHARTNLSTTSVAIFDRAADAISVSPSRAFLDGQHQATTAQLLERYQIALLPG